VTMAGLPSGPSSAGIAAKNESPALILNRVGNGRKMGTHPN
jgi:hypothetical protein